MEIIAALKDVAHHLLIINGIEWVRIEGTLTSCVLKAVNVKSGVLIKIVMNEPIPNMIGTFGIPDISNLSRILHAPGFHIATASAQFIDRESGNERWEGGFLHFDNGAGQTYDMTVTGELLTNEQMKVPPLKPVQFDTAFSPDHTGIDLLKYWHKEMQRYDADAVAFVNKNGNVTCRYRFGYRESYQFSFKKSAGTNFQADWKFATEPIIAILSLYPTSKSVMMSICDRGLLKIDVDSGLANYRYLIAARQGTRSTPDPTELPRRSREEIIAHHREMRIRIEAETAAFAAKNSATS